MKGKNARIFFGDKEVGKVKSWEIKGALPIPEELSFSGIYELKDHEGRGMDFLKATIADGKNEITGFIYSPTGEKREARMRVLVNMDGQISLEPIDNDDREWVKSWIMEAM
jgi:hypothetical protein